MSIELSPDINIPYDNENEQLLKKFGENCLIYSILFREAYEYYDKLILGLNIPCIILSSLSSLLSFLNDKISVVFSMFYVVVGFLSFLSATITTLITFMKLNQKLSNARISQTQFSRLYRTIEIQLALKKEDRTGFNEVIKYVKDTYNTIKENSDELPDFILNRFKNKYRNNHNIVYPEEISLRPIEVNQKSRLDLKPQTPIMPI